MNGQKKRFELFHYPLELQFLDIYLLLQEFLPISLFFHRFEFLQKLVHKKLKLSIPL